MGRRKVSNNGGRGLVNKERGLSDKRGRGLSNKEGRGLSGLGCRLSTSFGSSRRGGVLGGGCKVIHVPSETVSRSGMDPVDAVSELAMFPSTSCKTVNI